MSEEHIGADEMRARGYEPATIAERERIDRARTEAAALIPQIEQAFKGVPRPRITLRVARGYDDEWDLSEERIRELSALDREYDWTEVEDSAIERFQEYFSFSDAEGWRFYLPAFMCHYLRDFPYRGYIAVYPVCMSRKHFEALTPEQLACVDRFFELCQRHEDHERRRWPTMLGGESS